MNQACNPQTLPLTFGVVLSGSKDMYAEDAYSCMGNQCVNREIQMEKHKMSVITQCHDRVRN